MDTEAASNEKKTISPGWQVPFYSIWIGQVFSLVSSRVVEFALVWWLTEKTGSATVLALSTMVAIIPQVILGPFIGAYVDRLDRRKVMIVADSLVALFALWLAYLFWVDSIQIWHIYVAVALRSVGGAFHWPAMQATTSLMVPEEHLTRVAGINQTLNGALNMVGPPLGALLLRVLPFYGVMLTDVMAAFIAVTALFFVRVPQPKKIGGDGAQTSVLEDLREGMRYVFGWPGLVVVLFIAMLLNFVMNPAFSLMPLLVTDHFGGDALQLGWLESGWGVGLVLGGLVLSAWGGFKNRAYTSMLGLIIEGIAVMLVGLAPSNALWLALVGMFVSGIMNAFVNGPLFALLQAVVDPAKQGRVFTVVMSMSSAAWPLSLAVAGPIADAVGVRPWYVVGGLVSAVVGVVGCFVPVIVNMEADARKSTSTVAGTVEEVI
jgi:DHA3 family macrolide efflux protein-like MFS transporter